MLKKRKQKYWSLVLIGLFITVTFSYVLAKGDGIYIQVHDTLDNNIVWLKMLKDNDLFWQRGGEVPFLGGVDRNNLYSPLKVYVWLYMLFPVFPAIIIGWYLKIIIAVTGFLFLGRILYGNNENFNLIALSGFLYGILPTLPSCAIEFASIPFLLGTLILFYRNSELKYLFGLFLYPFFSRFAVFGIFFCGYLLLFFLINWGVKKKPCWKMLIALLTLSAGYIFTEWRLFYIMLLSGEKNIHLMFTKQYLSVFEALQNSLNVFVYGQYHCGSLHMYIVLPVCLIFFVYINYIYIKNHTLKKIFNDKFNWILVWIVLNCIIYGLAKTEELWRLIDIIIPQLKGFGFERAIWMNPFLWYLAFMIVICRMSKDIIKYFLLFLAFCILCLKPSMYNHIYLNLRSIAYEFFEGEKSNELTYGEFYSVNLFEKIKKSIGYDGEWSIAFGMHPAVLEYNGIATLDGYLSYYSSYYHSQFRKLIEPQLNIDEANANYYDRWGGRAYIFSDVVSTDPVKKMNVDSSVLNIDPDVFRELEGKYIFSRVAITNALDLGIKEVGVYSSEDSPYTIYVYKLI